MVRAELATIVSQMAGDEYLEDVRRLREIWHLMHPTKTEDGQFVSDFRYKMTLPRLCFVAELQRVKENHWLRAYNGLIVLEANNLSIYDEAIALRDKAARLPQTLLAFLGASGHSAKIVCRGELLPDNG